MKLKSHSGSAFTLLEIMLVVMIIAMLAGSAIMMFGNSFGEAKDGITRAEIQSLRTPLMMYEAKNGAPPSTAQGLQALVTKPSAEPVPKRWTQLSTTIPTDPWKQPYNYASPGKHNPNGYDIFSSGPDRKPGTADDIGNWEDK